MATKSASLHTLVRAESLKGRAYARLARPSLTSGFNLGAALLVAGTSLLLLLLALAFTPIATKFVGSGFVSGPQGGTVLRAPRSGQVVLIPGLGSVVKTGEPVAIVEVRTETTSGLDPFARTEESLLALGKGIAADLGRIDDKFRLRRDQLAADRTALLSRLSSQEKATALAEVVAVQSERLSNRVMAEAQAAVSRVDAVAILERATSAKSRVLELGASNDQLRAQIENNTRATRIASVERDLERSSAIRQHAGMEAQLTALAGNYRATVTSPTTGNVLAAYKTVGEWVDSGEALALIAPQSEDPQTHTIIRVPIADEFALAVRSGAPARVWADPRRRTATPALGQVVAIERSGDYAIDDKFATAPRSRGSGFVALVRADRTALLRDPDAPMPPLDARVDVEIAVGSQRLFEALLPSRIRPSRGAP